MFGSDWKSELSPAGFGAPTIFLVLYFNASSDRAVLITDSGDVPLFTVFVGVSMIFITFRREPIHAPAANTQTREVGLAR